MIFALVGNQNCGKTTLFNALTGANQHVGNFPGVTVDQTVGEVKWDRSLSIVDLPGIYSIRPYTQEEIITRDFVLKNKPSGIINIVDATNIERNLYLTLQLLELKIPTVIALNMMDEVRGSGGVVDVKKLASHLGVPVVPISAAKNEGIKELMDVAASVAKTKTLPARLDFCPEGSVHRAIHAVSHVIEDHAMRLDISPRFAATKVIEGDPSITEALGLSQNELELIEHTVFEMEHESGFERNEAIASMRYDFIEEVASLTVKKPKESKERLRSLAIDKIVTHKWLALPVFFGVMFLTFWLTFGPLGSLLADGFTWCIDALIGLVDTGLGAWGINPVVKSLVIDGILAGVGSMLSFLPPILLLFFFLSILEDSGYMARVAFVMDKLMRKIGLSGKSFVPMLMGFGCSVPALMATRTLSSNRDRKMTLLLVPFMSCSAKIPIYGLFSRLFFPRYAPFVMIGLYVGGIILGILAALVLKNTLYRGKPVPFVMELPNYRFPSPKSVCLLLWDKAKDFLVRAFTVILLGTVLIWFFSNFDFRFNVVEDPDGSILASLAKWISPLFVPLGFGDWRMTTALISGFTAKEAVVSTLEILAGGESGIAALFTTASALSFLTFTLLYTPCVAAVATMKREFESGWKTILAILAQCGVAWGASVVVYHVSDLFSGGNLGMGDIFVLGAVLLLVIGAFVYTLLKKKQGKCIGCGGDCASCMHKK